MEIPSILCPMSCPSRVWTPSFVYWIYNWPVVGSFTESLTCSKVYGPGRVDHRLRGYSVLRLQVVDLWADRYDGDRVMIDALESIQWTGETPSEPKRPVTLSTCTGTVVVSQYILHYTHFPWTFPISPWISPNDPKCWWPFTPPLSSLSTTPTTFRVL